MSNITEYAKIKNNYCICYFGHNDEYLTQLKILVPILEKHFKGIKISIACKENKTYLLGDLAFPISNLKLRSQYFAHMKEVSFNGNEHPIEAFLRDCEIDECTITETVSNPTTKCVIISQGATPTRSLQPAQIETLRRIAQQRNFDVEVDGQIEDAGLVMGVESKELFEAAAQGIETILINTGLGACLYKKMYPKGVVMHI